MRTELKIFRVKQHLSQEEMAEKIGCKRSTYSSIEKGVRDGKQSFWLAFQKAFDIPDGEIWALMHKEEGEQDNEAKG